MSFTIRNIAGAPVEIDDIGIRLEIGEDVSLAEEASKDIAISTDLIVAIQANEIIVLDPLDGATPLTINQSVEAIQVANDTHFRIRGGELAQLDDVSGTIPTDGYVLTYNQIANLWEPQVGSTSTIPTCFPFFKEDGTQDNIPIEYCVGGSPSPSPVQYLNKAGDTATGDIIGTDFVKTLSGTITRTSNLVSQIAKTGGRTLTITRDINNRIITVGDGTRTFTFNRTSNKITSWTVA